MNRQDGQTEAVRVVVVGAGYAGMIATNRFLGSLTREERQRITLTVVNVRPDFVERIRLHELAAGSRDRVTIPLTEVLHPGARLITGRANLIDAESRAVHVATSAGEVVLPYDYLVYAVGSVAAAPMPGAREHSFLLADYEAAQRAADTIRDACDDARVTVIGGGFTGVEAASELAERRPDVQVALLCEGKLLHAMRPAARTAILETLRRLGVTVEEEATVTMIEEGRIHLADGRHHSFDVCIQATSFEVPDLAAVSGLAVDSVGRLRVDETLRSVDARNIIGAGDAVVAPPEVASHLRMGCAVALPLGGHAAETLLACIRGTQPTALSVGFLIQCISLGRKKAYIQPVRSDDTPRPFHVTGRTGAAIKEQICRLVVSSPVRESRKPGAYRWPKGPTRRRDSAIAEPSSPETEAERSR
jgi:NADH dehydrogenase FAD-containing subunit